jgi:hypothetical protein
MDQLKTATDALLKTLADATGQALDDLRPFAAEFAEPAVRWGVNLAAAKVAGDADAVAQYEEDFRYLANLAALKAGQYGVRVQGSIESFLQGALGMAGHLAAAAL